MGNKHRININNNTASPKDVFKYQLNNIDIEKDDKSSIPIINLEGEYEDIYLADLNNNENEFKLSQCIKFYN